LIDEGQAGSNQVAAVPSLHAAISMLLCTFFWPRVRRRWRPLLACYAVAMGFALVYSAEHYVFDILLGWLVTAVVVIGFGRWERSRGKRLNRGQNTVRASGDENPDARTDTLNGPIPARP
jgi:membrane-associated phospholipid phosphatase